MASLFRVLISAWLLLGWTPHGVCAIEAGVKRFLATPPVSKGCPFCRENGEASAGSVISRQASPTSFNGSGRTVPNFPPAKCCHPDAAVTAGKVSTDSANKPVFARVLALTCLGFPISAQLSSEGFGPARSGPSCEAVPLHLRLCVLQI